MSNDNVLFEAFLSILTERVNRDGYVDDAEVCADIAAYINMLPFTVPWSMTLHDFIYEYGEDEECDYLGRDEHGEKRYVVYNPDTNWGELVRRELVKLNYYKRHQDWWDAQKVA